MKKREQKSFQLRNQEQAALHSIEEENSKYGGNQWTDLSLKEICMQNIAGTQEDLELYAKISEAGAFPLPL